MLEKLTKAQEKKLKVYSDKWIKIGLCTKRANRKVAEKACREAYKVARLKPPGIILWAESPLGLLMTAKLIKEIASKGYEPYAEGIGASVWASVWASVGDSVWASVRASVRASVGASVLKTEWNECYSYGQHDANWLSFYEYFLEVCHLKDCKKLIPLMNLAKETGWHLFYANVAILSEKPTEVNRNEHGQLHSFNGPAIKWADGYELYRFNGVRIDGKEELATKETFSKEEILKEQNADVRREIIRKLGIEKAMEILDTKVIDKHKGYELVTIDIGDNRIRPYLKMINPSIGVTHLEGVRPEITTVKDAICYRNNLTKYEEPQELT